MRCVILGIMLLLVACSSEEQPVTQVGYYKSGVNDRIFTGRLSDKATEADARAYAEGRMHTDGQMTAVYIYANDATIPEDGMTLAGSIFDANEVLEYPNMSAWTYAFMRYRNGQVEFADCSATVSTLCR